MVKNVMFEWVKCRFEWVKCNVWMVKNVMFEWVVVCAEG